MQKVVTINLNGNAYQVDEDGYNLVDNYLRKAAQKLAGNPDINEIMSDLEQAVADKFRHFLRRDKNVVTGEEVRGILAEMGPVDPGPGPEAESDSPGSAPGESGSPRAEPRRLYRLKDDAMIEGVCAGIAAYFGLDPTIVRVIAVVLLATTAGSVGVVYILLWMVIPEARTPEERAAAYGAPFNAEDVLRQAKSKFDDVAGPGGERLKRQWQAQQRYWRNQDGDAGNWLPFVLLFFGLFFLVRMIARPGIVRIPGTMPMMDFWMGPWFPILIILAGLVVLFSGQRQIQGVLATVLAIVVALVVLAFLFRTIPMLQIWLSQLSVWWCSSPLGAC
jgi:phage shock protein PspC (stress-responsive transcriptional regulator)